MATTSESILNGNPALAAVINDIAEVAGHIWQKGWGERNGGNITVNISEYASPLWSSLPALKANISLGCTLPGLQGQFFYAKGTQKRMRDLARQPMLNGSIIRITGDCAHYDIIADNCIMPTSELPSHLMVQNHLIATGSSYKDTLHTHPIELVAMSHNPRFLQTDKTASDMLTANLLTRTLWSMIPETLAFAPLGIGIVPYQMPGSIELAQATLAQIQNYDVVLWEKHGTFSVGKDIIDAFDQTDVLNKAAVIYMRARSMGFEPDGMTDRQMADLRKTFALPDKRQNS